MISTFQALVVAALALVPGAAYTFAYERVAGAFGDKLSDRFIRFLVASAFFHAFAAGPEFALWRDMVRTGRVERADVSSTLVEVIALSYVLLPTGVGWLVGRGQRDGWRLVQWLVGEAPQPRAWDFLWGPNTQALVRMRLKSGIWLAGLFGTTEDGRRSYASGYPEEGDLYLSLQLKVDRSSGAFITDSAGLPQPVTDRTGLHVRWCEIEYMDVKEL